MRSSQIELYIVRFSVLQIWASDLLSSSACEVRRLVCRIMGETLSSHDPLAFRTSLTTLTGLTRSWIGLRFAPKGQHYVSPGQRPGVSKRRNWSTNGAGLTELRYRREFGAAPLALEYWGRLPRALPWADIGLPRWGEDRLLFPIHPQRSRTPRRFLQPGVWLSRRWSSQHAETKQGEEVDRQRIGPEIPYFVFLLRLSTSSRCAELLSSQVRGWEPCSPTFRPLAA